MSSAPNAVMATDFDDEPYDSAEDEDFSLDAAQDDSDASESDEAAEPATKRRKTDKKAEIPEDELDSGDEATIRKAKEKKAKRRKGKSPRARLRTKMTILIWMTKRARVGFQEERKPLAKIDGATVDVNDLWEKMNAPESQIGLLTSQVKDDTEPTPVAGQADVEMQDQNVPESEDQPRPSKGAEQMIKIKRTYEFAGEKITEEKVVPKDSAEAKAFLSSGENVEYADVDEAKAADTTGNLRRPLRKISRFDPNPTGVIKKSWEKQPAEVGADGARGPKINTVEKSRLDWAQYVDQAGIKDELRVHSKAKEGYIGRMDFLGRVEAKRDDEARQARLKGM
ncbi:Craniofacial development protein 1/Bucentaur [Penicillium capsulatum]|nr:Craniofacial development protein 1/Bucentaur [Penicillium capsulatum]